MTNTKLETSEKAGASQVIARKDSGSLNRTRGDATRGDRPSQMRLHIQNDTHMAEFPDNRIGEIQIKAFRKSHPQFKRRRIRKVWQALPSRVPCGDIIEMT